MEVVESNREDNSDIGVKEVIKKLETKKKTQTQGMKKGHPAIHVCKPSETCTEKQSLRIISLNY